MVATLASARRNSERFHRSAPRGSSASENSSDTNLWRLGGRAANAR